VKYLLDTCVISEIKKPEPAFQVRSWLLSQAEQNLFLSVLTLGEVFKGIERLPLSRKRMNLQEWLDGDLSIRFEGRIYEISSEIAYESGKLAALAENSGKKISSVDGLISATARVHRCILVTRNTPDMPLSPEEMLNPWHT
jgi:toxin FitB